MKSLLTARPVVLASRSPRRRDLLQQIGITPRIWQTDAPELTALTDSLTPEQLTEINARRKAEAALAELQGTDAWIIAADTVVVCGKALFGKPQDPADAVRMLRALSGGQSAVVTGQCVVDALSGAQLAGSRCTRVQFAELTEEEIAAYVQTGEPLDKAGAYGMQEQAGLFVAEICGDYSTVVGLSLPLLREQIRQLSLNLGKEIFPAARN